MTFSICMPVGPEATSTDTRLTLASIATQTVPGTQVVIKTLGTHLECELLAQMAEFSLPGLVLGGTDAGIYDAFNQCVTAASEEWIILLGCGDELAGPEVIGALDRAVQVGGTDIFYGQVLVADPIQGVTLFDNSCFFKKRRVLPWRNPCHSQGLVYRRAWLMQRPFRLDAGPLADLIHTHSHRVHQLARWIDRPITIFKVGGASNLITHRAYKNRLKGVLENCNNFTPARLFKAVSYVLLTWRYYSRKHSRDCIRSS